MRTAGRGQDVRPEKTLYLQFGKVDYIDTRFAPVDYIDKKFAPPAVVLSNT